MKTEELCKTAVRSSPYAAIGFVPQEFHNRDWYQKALNETVTDSITEIIH
jgi:hypothetical protein